VIKIIRKKIITNIQYTNFDFDEPSTDDDNNQRDINIQLIECPFYKEIIKNPKFHDFEKDKKDFVELFEVDNELDTDYDYLDYIIQCPYCKKFFKILFEESTNKKIVVRLLKNSN
jgi:hypothetical protein